MKLIRDIKLLEKDMSDIKYVLVDLYNRVCALEEHTKIIRPKATKKRKTKKN